MTVPSSRVEDGRIGSGGCSDSNSAMAINVAKKIATMVSGNVSCSIVVLLEWNVAWISENSKGRIVRLGVLAWMPVCGW
jgi:hypothetical protein